MPQLWGDSLGLATLSAALPDESLSLSRRSMKCTEICSRSFFQRDQIYSNRLIMYRPESHNPGCALVSKPETHKYHQTVDKFFLHSFCISVYRNEISAVTALGSKLLWGSLQYVDGFENNSAVTYQAAPGHIQYAKMCLAAYTRLTKDVVFFLFANVFKIFLCTIWIWDKEFEKSVCPFDKVTDFLSASYNKWCSLSCEHYFLPKLKVIRLFKCWDFYVCVFVCALIYKFWCLLGKKRVRLLFYQTQYKVVCWCCQVSQLNLMWYEFFNVYLIIAF